VDIASVVILSHGGTVSRTILIISVATHKEFLSRDAMAMVILSQLDQHLNETLRIIQTVHNTRQRIHHICAVSLKLGVRG
jgi:serine kinase of HPr protein (carbohydrate metabolism regulator)